MWRDVTSQRLWVWAVVTCFPAITAVAQNQATENPTVPSVETQALLQWNVRTGREGAPILRLAQQSEVRQGGIGIFEIETAEGPNGGPFVLRLRNTVGTGQAAFEDGNKEKTVQHGGEIKVVGLVASDIPGALELSAWKEGEGQPQARLYFDVVAAKPEPRIYFDGRDITEKTEAVAAGQEVTLTVILHPSLKIVSEEWSIGEAGEAVGGFVHSALRGGPQPIVTRGSTTKFYWVTVGRNRRVKYHLQLENGEETTACAWFDVLGPADVEIAALWKRLTVGPALGGGTSYMGLADEGVTFRASYELKRELVKNFTWVQLIREDQIVVTTAAHKLLCMPQARPIAETGSGLDTTYPYDSRNPTRDSPPVELTDDADGMSRRLRAEMYLLWSSGRPNSIAVPLGSMAWSLSGEAVRKARNKWQLIKGDAGVESDGFHAERSYPQWNSLIPYSGVLTCQEEKR